MKKILIVFLAVAVFFSLTVPVFAARPDIPPGQLVKEEVHERNMLAKEEKLEFKKDKDHGAEFYNFYLSGDVMPVPPYGEIDIEESDVKSKLIVNKPNGKVAANVTGVMKGLLPETEYMVYLSNGYLPFNITDEWNIVGDYVFELTYGDSTYTHDISITSVIDGVVEGTDGAPAGGPYNDSGTLSGTFDGAILELTSVYTVGNIGYTYSIMIEVDEDGLLTGTWQHNGEGDLLGLVVTSGTAYKITEGNTTWPGLLNEDLYPGFSFTTDEEGHGSWHVSILWEAVECQEEFFEFSVWVNSFITGKTVLISDTITIECLE